MIKIHFFSIVLFSFSCTMSIHGQIIKKDTIHHQKNRKLKALLIPTLLVGYGAFSLNNKSLKKLDLSIYNKLNKSEHGKIRLDNYAQFVPIITVYGLNAFGVKGAHNFKDRTIILTTASIFMGSTTYGIKTISNRKRPRSNAENSFPSGHTATAFMAAEFLRQEYKNVSVWYGIAGYTIATGTGFLRLYNNRHWFSDVVTGAGIGILSVQAAYWLEPFIQRTFFKTKSGNLKTTAVAIPYYNGESYSIGMTLQF